MGGLQALHATQPLWIVEVVEHDMHLLARMERDEVVHEGEELDAAAALLVGGRHLPGRQVERGEQPSSCLAATLSRELAQRHEDHNGPAVIRPLLRASAASHQP